MAELHPAAGINPDLVEELAKTHFGLTFTSRLAWDFVRGRYVASEIPGRLATPQALFGIRIGWKTVGQFTNNLGFRLELWDPGWRSQAEAFVTEYNARTSGTKVELYPCLMHWSATAGQAS
jgi:hypothetical protein